MNLVSRVLVVAVVALAVVGCADGDETALLADHLDFVCSVDEPSCAFAPKANGSACTEDWQCESESCDTVAETCADPSGDGGSCVKDSDCATFCRGPGTCGPSPVCVGAGDLGELPDGVSVAPNFTTVAAAQGDGTCGYVQTADFCPWCVHKAVSFTLTDSASLDISYTAPETGHIFIRSDCDDAESAVFCQHPGYSNSHWNFGVLLPAGTYSIHIASGGEPSVSSALLRADYEQAPPEGTGEPATGHYCDTHCGEQSPSECYCDGECVSYGDCCDALGTGNAPHCTGSTCSACQG
jgi:hypothetical protein